MKVGWLLLKNDDEFMQNYFAGEDEQGNDIEFRDDPRRPSGAPGMTTLVMPDSAYDTIMETLHMDLRSKSMDDEIKFELQRAIDQIQRVQK